jgi:metal-sulfur cluster biosynthetic enzyme
MDLQEDQTKGPGDPSTKDRILGALRQVVDPELGINIVDLGLVYDVEILDGQVRVKMTMTSPACPLHDYLSEMVHTAIGVCVPNVRSVEVVLVWDPPWSPERMSEEARRQMGWPR